MSEAEIKQNIIGLPETIFILLLVGMEELVEFFILVITLGTGIMVVEVMDGAMGGALEMYMGLRGPGGIIKWIVEPIGTFINGISGSLLPGKTVATAVGIWVINHPEVIDKLAGAVAKVAGTAVKVATTVVGGAAGGVVGAVAGGVARSAVAGVGEKVVEMGASGTRQRMAMATGVSSKKLEGINRARQAQERAKQSMSKEGPQGIPEEVA